ncbi:hypothetical protein MBAV_003525, partial [Candidatus Magnetobacterium bavaricum]
MAFCKDFTVRIKNIFRNVFISNCLYINNLYPFSLRIADNKLAGLGKKLKVFFDRYSGCFKTKTMDNSEYGYHYIHGQLRMDNERNFANIGREEGVNTQNMHPFMSNS